MNKSLFTNLLAFVFILIGWFSPWYSKEILAMGLYSFSGAITNWLAIHMLFEKVPFLYGSGIITDRFEEFKSAIKNLIMTQFFTIENFEKFIGENSSSLIQIEESTIIDSINYDSVFIKLKEAILASPFGGMLGMFGGPAALDPLRPQFEQKFKEIISEMLQDENFLKNLTKNSESEIASKSIIENVQLIVDQRLNELTPIMVKEIIQEMIREHLGWLVVWGGIFGALIGLISTFIV